MNEGADPKLSYRDLQCFKNSEKNIQTNIGSQRNSCQRTPKSTSQQNLGLSKI